MPVVKRCFFVKTGGLGDVASVLPAALAGPARTWPCLDIARPARGRRTRCGVHADLLRIEAGGIDHHIGVGIAVSGVTVYLLACNELFDRDGITDRHWGLITTTMPADMPCSAKLFCPAQHARLDAACAHAHDWQTGLIPALLERGFIHDLPATRSVFSIHNIAYQGLLALPSA